MRPCYAFAAAKAAGEPETLSIYDEIGFWGVQASDFRTALAAVKSSTINVEINSPGGDVFAGVAIYNMLKASGKEVVVKVMGVAASAASLIAMAGSKRQMPKNTMLMVHNPWSFAMGNADELRDTADTLDKIGNSLLGTYMAATGMAEPEMKALLAKDTWLTADEALEMGFATEVTDEIKVSAKFDLARAELPAKVQAALGLSPKAELTPEEIAAQEAETARLAAEEAEAARLAAAGQSTDPIAEQVSALAVKAGLADYAPAWAVACTTVAEAQARISTAREINALCTVAKKADSAKAFIAANKTVAEARASLAEAMAKEDEDNPVDTTPRDKNPKMAGKGGKPKAVNTQSIWDSHNAQSMKKGS